MLKVRVPFSTGFLLAVGFGLIIVAEQMIPQRLAESHAAGSVGGCGSGMCSGETYKACGQVGDGCGSYEQCTPDLNGTMLCNPSTYCTAAGCTVVHGASCY